MKVIEMKDLIVEDSFKVNEDGSIEVIGGKFEKGKLSDGYHTFDELYYHRMVLFSIICNTYKEQAWKSWKHHDDTMFDDYFIVGLQTPEGQYTYHYHKDEWDMFKVKELEKAPVYDGHKPSDITRLISLLK